MLGGSSFLPKSEVRQRLRLLGVVLSPVLILALVSLIAVLAQMPYYGHLFEQAHSHVALYHDALTHADGDWPDNAFSYFDQGFYHFQQTEYWSHLSYVAAPRRYDRALVEVSGRTGGTFDLDGVGLAIAGPSRSSPLLTFLVTPAGSWWLEPMSKTEAYEANPSHRFGDMSAIHRGFGVSNDIAVLMNGSTFTFYVNGHYATSYHDDALKGGDVCLYLGVTTESGDFSNFAVYPS
jgi:hypothetical protein